jgi:histidine triad (HIT) family protein
MSLLGLYDPDNVFARILRGEEPVTRVFEDDHVLGFMDAFPQSPGHILVIPKASTPRNLLEIDASELGLLIVAVQRLARAVKKALAPDGISVLQFNGAAGGQTVFHLHFHIIPRWEQKTLMPHAQGARASDHDLRSLADRISAAL